MSSSRRSWLLCGLVIGGALIATAQAGPAQTPSSGLDLRTFDRSVRPQDDLNAFVNGHWAATTIIPADRSSIGTFDQLQETSTKQLREIVDRLGRKSASLTDPNDRAVDAFYRSFMDTARLERLGLKPIDGILSSVEQISSRAELAEAFGSLSRVGVSVPLDAQVHPHQKRSTEYVLDFSQGGLGLPDRDYYLSDDDTFAKVRKAYLQHIERSLKVSGTPHADEAARQIVALETALARVQWSRVDNRNPVKTFNEVAVTDLPGVLADFNWVGFLGGLGAHAATVNISQPTYVRSLSDVLAAHPLSAWRLYLRWQVLRSYSPFLSKSLAGEHFAFYGTTLEGVPKQKERWKRGIELVDRQIGEALGRRYAETFFPPNSKARVETLVRNLIATYSADIDTLDWMGTDTKRAAHEKLDKLLLKIGYPDHWRDYSSVTIKADDLVGNVTRSTHFEHDRMMAKLGHPVDRTEWDMTPPTINAYYNPTVNEIVFPAGILQPPFFDAGADDAVNYGAVGAVIGHEISHGFDDEGSQFDAQGNLRNWWTEADKEAFNRKAKALVAEYSAFEPVKGFHINGELTLGENIADNSGLAIAYKAYQRSLDGREAPVIDGFTGPQRFYLGFGQVWRDKSRDEVVIELIKADPHSMPPFRVLGTVRNQPGYYDAFGVGPKDAAWLPPEQRVLMW